MGSETEGWNQVRMEHFDKVALTREPGEEGTGIGQGGHRRVRGEERGEYVSGTGTTIVLFYSRSNWKNLIKAGGRICDGKDCTLLP